MCWLNQVEPEFPDQFFDWASVFPLFSWVLSFEVAISSVNMYVR